MKANRIIAAVIGLALIVLALCVVPRIIVTRYWKQIDNLTEQERYRSALEYALKAKKVSHWCHLEPAYVRSLLYEVKCKNALQLGDEAIIQLLRTEKETNETPVRDIVTALYLEKVWDFYFCNLHRGNQQTFIDTSSDISKWSSKRVLKEIVSNMNDLQSNSTLRLIPFSDYQRQICSFSNSQVKFATVYEFVTWHSIDMLHWSNRFFQEDYIVHDSVEPFFVTLSDFLKMKIANTDTFNLSAKAMALYQDLLKFEVVHHHYRTTYEIEIQRLNSLKENLNLEVESEQYLNILAKYRASVKDEDARLLLDFAMFNEYDSQRRKDDLKRKCLEIIRSYPSWKPEVKECQRRRSEFSTKSINFLVENDYDSSDTVHIKVSSKNIDTIYLRLYRVNTISKTLKDISIQDDKTYRKYTNDCIDKKAILGRSDLFQTKEQEVSFNKLKAGTYLVALSRSRNLNIYTNVERWKVFQVSAIAGYGYNNNSETEIYAVKRNNGKPVPNASIIVLPKYAKSQTYITGNDGKAVIKNWLLKEKVLIAVGEDTVKYDVDSRSYDVRNKDDLETIHFFTDRAVYRPSQKIYFKGILDRSNVPQRKYTTVANRKVHVYFKSNGFTYGETQVTTNDFGSFSGSFTIPSKFPLGDMTIYTEYGEHSVEVEEYKPTRMRLTIMPNQQPVCIGDSVLVTGYTRYINGMPARNLAVSFTVRQDVNTGFRYSGSTSVLQGNIFSDNMGQFKVRLKTSPVSGDVERQFEYRYSFSFHCKDEFGEIQTGFCNVSVGNNSCDAKIKVDPCLLKQSGIHIPVEFQYDDHPVTPQRCRLTIYKLLPGSLKAEVSPRRWSRHSDFEDICFDSLKRGAIVFDHTLSDSKQYNFAASDLAKQEQGFYVAEVVAVMNNKIEIRKQQYFTLLDHAATNMKLNVEHFLVPFATEAQPGQSVLFLAGSALPDVYGLFVITQNGQIVQRCWVHLSQSQQALSIPVTESLRGGFHVSFVGYANNKFFRHTHFIKVPFNNKKLHLSFRSFRNNLYPGQQETWQLKVVDHLGKPANAEMVATLYDKALDEINPNHFSYFPYSDLEEREYERLGWEEMSSEAIEGEAIVNKTNLKESPSPYRGEFADVSFFPTINWSTDRRNRGRASFDFRQKEYERTKICCQKLTYSSLANSSSNEFPPPVMMTSIKFTPPEIEEDEMVGTTQDELMSSPKGKPPVAKIRKDFRETVFFLPEVRTDNNGLATVSFTMPDALTRWKMLGFAHTMDMKTGSIANELVTQKDFMVIPNWPRFLRSGDTILLNVRIENNTVRTITGNVLLEIEDGATHSSLAKSIVSGTRSKFSVKGRANSFAQWKILVPAKVSTMLFRIKASSGVSMDGEEMLLPVLPNEVLVTESMPLVMHGNEPKNFRFNNLANQSFKNIRNYQYVFELTPNPRWGIFSSLAYLADYPYDCVEQTIDKYFAFCLAEYVSAHTNMVHEFFNNKSKIGSLAAVSALDANPDLKSCLLEESPWLFEAKSETERLHKLTALFNANAIDAKKLDLLKKLSEFQNPDGGVAWFKGMHSDNYMSWYLLEALGKINKLGGTKYFHQQQPQFLTKLIYYCDDVMVNWYRAELKNKSAVPNTNAFQFIEYAYARSYFIREYPMKTQEMGAYHYMLNQFRTQWQKSSSYQRPMIALTLFRNRDYLTCNQIIESMKEMAVRDAEKGMYWNNKQSAYGDYNSIDAQAVTLELFAETRQDPGSVDEIKNWMYLQRKNNQWSSTITTARACYSMLLGDGSWQTNNTSYHVIIGTQKFSVGEPTSANPSGYIRKSWEASQITPGMGNVVVQPHSNAKGLATGSVSWQYFQTMGKGKETSSGLWVKKIYFVKRNNNYHSLANRERLKVGDEVIVRLDFGSDRNLSYVHLKDLRPTCLEPISQNSECHYQDGLCYFESIRDASQSFFIESLSKGKYIIEYKVRVTHGGYFQTGNASIQCMYAPEYVGYSGSENLRVD
jgi:hypothetical protein